ncbi:hypothetical protein RJT34_12662 [Clitoria ternatea]|uniref:Pentatricopeptide repeat-containing protein n=1 Tax=Clitoria ternatea TaxID=43366 RepID=A0AAN9PLL2_CLITE
MITAYASHPTTHPSALELFCHMLRFPTTPRPNHFIFPHVLKSCYESLVKTALVDSYSRVLGGLRCARKVFDELSERNVVSFTTMVSGYARVGDVDNALRLFNEMEERDVPCWNALIVGCTQNGLFN